MLDVVLIVILSAEAVVFLVLCGVLFRMWYRDRGRVSARRLREHRHWWQR